MATPVVKRTNGVISVNDDDFAPEHYTAINRGGRNNHRGFLRHPYHLLDSGDYHLLESGNYHLIDSDDYHLIDADERRNLVQRSPKGPIKLGKKTAIGIKKSIKNSKPGNLPGKKKNKVVKPKTKKSGKATFKSTKVSFKVGGKKLAKKGK